MSMHRRRFLAAAGCSGLARLGRAAEMPRASIRALTSGPRHHFFGYYGITPWNKSGRRLACLESAFQDHLPKPEEAAAIGLVDARSGKFSKLTETRAWNLQQGSMIHWDPASPETGILFNDRRGGELMAVSLDVESGRRRELPRALSAVSHNGRWALSLTYGRDARLRPVTGYVGAIDPYPDSAAPANDGVFLMEVAGGPARLIVSIAEVYERLLKRHPEIAPRHMWFGHTLFNTTDTRFLFFARVWSVPGKDGKTELESAMFTANTDGSELRQVIPFSSISHYDWLDDRRILATFRLAGGREGYYLFTDGKDDYRRLGDSFFRGGHPSFSPDRAWIITDANDGKKREKQLMLYHLASDTGVVLGSFPMREYISGDLRCDLHPRWDRSGRQVCFDALETRTWTRQLHLARLEI